jgi:glycosyltransferase involved in cell wall biosynthesis
MEKQLMEINIPIEDLRKRKLFVATPMYGGQCAGMFAKSTADLSAICTQYGIPLQFYYLFNESLITRARNYCVDEFMRSEAEHLMFIDSDIGFNPQDVIALMALQAGDPDKYDIIGGPYPKKCISWEKIKHAVDKGVADEDPNILERFVGDYVFNPKSGTTSIQISEPCEVLEIGTGFMMVTKQALKKFADSYPQYYYRPDHVRTEAFDGSREIPQYFQAEIDPASKRYLSEDYWFCQKAQEIGLKTWFCPWMKMQHVGSYIFGGSLADLASIGAAATADPGNLGGKKKK